MTGETSGVTNSYDLRLFLETANVLLERGIRPTGILDYVNKIEDEQLRDEFKERLFENISPEDANRIQKVIEAREIIEANNQPLARVRR